MNLYKKTVPYLLMGAAFLLKSNSAAAQTNVFDIPRLKIEQTNLATLPNYEFSLVNYFPIMQLVQKADNLRNLFIDNVLESRKKIVATRGKHGYNRAVKKELPGAPVRLHCMFGQYTNLNRALDALGDTMKIIPANASRACFAFIDEMKKEYGTPEFAGSLYEGRAYESDSAYNAALEKYLRTHGATDGDKRAAATQQFAKNNFSIEHVTPGTILIVPRPRDHRKRHAILFLGRGTATKNGDFVETPNGKWMYAGFNNESIGNLFTSYDMSKVFGADIKKISTQIYARELKTLESLPTDQLIQYISHGTTISVLELKKLSRSELIKMVRAKYFGKPMRKFNPVSPIAMIANNHQQTRS